MEYDLRYRNIIDVSQVTTPITIIGAGGIGSPLALMLVKMGYPHITIWDDDTVEAQNVGAQLYPPAAIGQRKVDALRELIDPHKYETQNIEYHPVRWLKTTGKTAILILAVDSMAARSQIWTQAQDYVLIIDARMGGEMLRLYTIATPQEREYYATTLYPDSEAAQIPCTRRAILYNTFVIAGLIGAQLTRYLKHQPYQWEITMDLRNMILQS